MLLSVGRQDIRFDQEKSSLLKITLSLRRKRKIVVRTILQLLYARFIHHFRDLKAPLTDLVRKFQ
jgi:hypothetical protein